MDSEEIWAPIEGYESVYDVSSHGRIRTRRTNRIRKAHDNGRGYLRVMLSEKNVQQTFYVHRLVAKAFVTEGSGPEVNHKDLNKQNNRDTNLEWCSKDTNMTHWWNTAKGNWPRGRSLRLGEKVRNG